MCRTRSTLLLRAACAAALALAAGCDDSAAPGASSAGAAAPGPGSASAAPAAGEGAAAPPMRILSLAPNLTEILFAMGLGDHIVGRTTYCLHPPEAAALPAVGDTLHLDLEAIIRAEPTLAFTVTRLPETVRRLEGLGIRVVPVENDRMGQLREAIATIGRETGRPEAAAALLKTIEADLAAVRGRVAGLARPRTLFAFPMTVGSPRIMIAGRGSFVDELLDVAGAENAYPDAADWPTVSPQQVVAMQPEVVVINAAVPGPAGRDEAIRRGWESLSSVPAVRDGRVYVLPEAYLTIPGPRVGQAARVLAETIHPDLAGEAAP